MFAFDFLLAAALLTAPPDTPPPSASPELHARLQPALQALALHWEILDQREVRHLLTKPDDFGDDLTRMRRRSAELEDAPSLADCQRFPERAVISDLLAFNRAYRQHVDNCLSVELVRWWELREALQECDRLYQIWDNIRDATCDYNFVRDRRLALKRLREMLGDEAYYAGTLPPHVPIWRFQRID